MGGMETLIEPEPPPGATLPLDAATDDVIVDAFTSVMIAGVEVCAETVTRQIHSGAIELDALGARERNVVLQLCEVARRRADAAVTLVVDSADRSGSYGADGHASVRGWTKALCRWSDHDARCHVDLMRLCRDNELTGTEYLAGRLGRSQVLRLAKLALHPRVGHLYSQRRQHVIHWTFASSMRIEYLLFPLGRGKTPFASSYAGLSNGVPSSSRRGSM
jgi:hypothetical protein